MQANNGVKKALAAAQRNLLEGLHALMHVLFALRPAFSVLATELKVDPSESLSNIGSKQDI